VSSAAYFSADEPIPLADFEAWCKAVGATYSPNTVGGNAWYHGDLEVTFGDPTYRDRWQDNRPPSRATRATISTYHRGNVRGVAALALSFWVGFHVAMKADPEVKHAVLRAAVNTG
jgi:hypothetical protein